MSEAQRKFYLEQAEICERAAADAESLAARQELFDRRDAWLRLAKMIPPARRFRWQNDPGD